MLSQHRHELKLKLFLLSIFCFCAVPKTQALEIALSGDVGSGGGGGKIGVVDMQKIYQLSPKTLNAKDDYMHKLQDKKDFLAKKEKDLESIKNQISVLETTMKSAQEAAPSSSTDTASNVIPPTAPANLADLKQQLETKQAEYQDARKQATDDLAAFEKNQNQIIFGDIYKALKDVAEEEQVAIIVDKSSVLFGATEIDLTEKLQARVRGF